MKRLIWLLILVFGTALAQVAPVDSGSQKGKTCSCCDAAGSCGNRDCGLPPSTAASTSWLAEQPGQSVSTATCRKTVRPYRLAVNYLSRALEYSPLPNSCRFSLVAVERMPLFKAQCRFLI